MYILDHFLSHTETPADTNEFGIHDFFLWERCIGDTEFYKGVDVWVKGNCEIVDFMDLDYLKRLDEVAIEKEDQQYGQSKWKRSYSKRGMEGIR